MRARLIKIQASSSRKTPGGVAYLLCFKGEDGKSYQSWVDSGFRNYQNWKPVMKDGAVLSNLSVKKGNLIDADSRPVLIKEKGDDDERNLIPTGDKPEGTAEETGGRPEEVDGDEQRGNQPKLI